MPLLHRLWCSATLNLQQLPAWHRSDEDQDVRTTIIKVLWGVTRDSIWINVRYNLYLNFNWF